MVFHPRKPLKCNADQALSKIHDSGAANSQKGQFDDYHGVTHIFMFQNALGTGNPLRFPLALGTVWPVA